MKPQYIKILSYIDAHGGAVNTEELNSIEGTGTRFLGPLCIGRFPNCIISSDGKVHITERGIKTLTESGVEVTTTNAPIVKRDNELQKKSIVQVIIDRNSEVTVTCKINQALADFLVANGRRCLVSSIGENMVKNWDCEQETKYVQISLGELDRNFERTSNIISEYGINPLVIKIAAMNNGVWKVKYKGLVSKENLELYAKKLQEGCKKFYMDFVKPVRFEVNISMWE